MRKVMSLMLFLCLMAVVGNKPALAQTTWSHVYIGAGHDYANSIQQTSDGGYIVAGYTASFGAGSVDFWVLKLDASGNVTWQRTYGGGGNPEIASSIQQTSDGGYIVAQGATPFISFGPGDSWVLKLDGNGAMDASCNFIFDTFVSPIDSTATVIDTFVTGPFSLGIAIDTSVIGIPSFGTDTIICSSGPVTTTTTSTTTTTLAPTTTTSTTTTTTITTTTSTTTTTTTTTTSTTTTTTTTTTSTTTTTTTTTTSTTTTTTQATTSTTSSTTTTSTVPTTTTSVTTTTTSSTTTTTVPITTTTTVPTTTTTVTTTTLAPTTTSSTSTTTSTTTTTTTPPLNSPPDLSGANPSISALQPPAHAPNHQMVNISILGVTDPDGDPVAITITGITQDEPVLGLGSGDTCPDGAGVGTSTAQVRAERAGTGNGRVYRISLRQAMERAAYPVVR